MAALTDEYQGRRTLVDYDDDVRGEDKRVAVFGQYVSLTDTIDAAEREVSELHERLAKLREQREELRHHLLDYLGAGMNAAAMTVKGIF